MKATNNKTELEERQQLQERLLFYKHEFNILKKPICTAMWLTALIRKIL